MFKTVSMGTPCGRCVYVDKDNTLTTRGQAGEPAGVTQCSKVFVILKVNLELNLATHVRDSVYGHTMQTFCVRRQRHYTDQKGSG